MINGSPRSWMILRKKLRLSIVNSIISLQSSPVVSSSKELKIIFLIKRTQFLLLDSKLMDITTSRLAHSKTLAHNLTLSNLKQRFNSANIWGLMSLKDNGGIRSLGVAILDKRLETPISKLGKMKISCKNTTELLKRQLFKTP
jgi:hypothetical protein